MDEELMAKFLMGECSEEELCKVNAWLDESDGNARELFRIEQIYHLGKSEEFADEKKIEKYLAGFAKVKDTYVTLDFLEKAVKAGEMDTTRVKGDAKINPFELPTGVRK